MQKKKKVLKMHDSTYSYLHPNVYTEGLCYYPFAVNLDRYVRNCNTLNDLSNKVCVPKKNKI